MSLPDLPEPTLRLRIDTQALADNWRALNRLSGSARAGAAVKANAYGVGIAQALPVLLDAGARDFFVAHWSEVPPLLGGVDPACISVLHGVTTAREAAFARATGVRPVLNSVHQIALWHEAGGGPAHLMIDSGINRLGLEPALIGDPAVRALDVDILMSHLSSADEDSDLNARQLAIFRAAIAAIPARTHSLANSAGIALGPQYHFALTRPGLALYGGVPRPELANEIKQVVRPEAAVLQVRDIAAGDPVGYNASWHAPAQMRVATVSLGYADGLLRCWGGKVALQHEGRDLPVLGKVSMDMIVVDCRHAPDVRVGNFLGVPYDLRKSADASGLSQYELLTILGHRFARN